MPGALPTIWCELRGMPKDDQRGLVQPYITAMQLLALVLMLSHNALPSRMLLDLTLSLPRSGGRRGAWRHDVPAHWRCAVPARRARLLLVAGLALVV